MSSLHQTQGWPCAPIRATGKIHWAFFLLPSSFILLPPFLFFSSLLFLTYYSFLVFFFSFLLLTSSSFFLFFFLLHSSSFLLSLLNLCALSVFVSETSPLAVITPPSPLGEGQGVRLNRFFWHCCHRRCRSYPYRHCPHRGSRAQSPHRYGVRGACLCTGAPLL